LDNHFHSGFDWIIKFKDSVGQMNSALSILYKDNMREIQEKYDAIVVGLGITGMSCVRYLSRNLLKLAVVDSRNEPPQFKTLRSEFPEIPVFLGEFDQNLFSSTEKLIVSPGVPLSNPVIQKVMEKGVEISGDIELFLEKAKAPVIAITGSNGKSTVAMLISEMISASGKKVLLGGNIGTPALSLLEFDVPDYYVLELSSFQLESTQHINAIVSSVLNISEDHMDRYKNFQEYLLAKKKIFMGDGIKVINLDDAVIKSMVNIDDNIIYFTQNEPDGGTFGIRIIDDVDWICFGNQKIISVSEIGIKGRHNILNSLASLALGHAIGLEFLHMAEALKQYKGLPHRCEFIANIDGVDWVNDSKGTNPGATCAAVEGLAKGENIVLIAGGDAKEADLSSLGLSLKGRVHTAILIGKDALKLEQVISDNCTVIHAISLEAAVKTAKKLSSSGDTVLLSPACSSLDMFTDYTERGEEFIRNVKQLEKNGGTEL